MRSFGINSLTGTEIFSLHVRSLHEAVSVLSPTTNYFTILIACDSEQLTAEEISSFAGTLIEKGAIYVCTWGKGCKRFHDIVDEVVVEREVLKNMQRSGMLMTTWHEKETLDEALWFLLSCAWPNDSELESCCTIVLTVGNESWGQIVTSRLKNIDQFRQQQADAD